MSLNCKVIEKWQSPISTPTPPFKVYSPFLTKNFEPLLTSDSIFGRSYPLAFNKVGGRFQLCVCYQIYFDFFGMYIIETHCIQNYTWYTSLKSLPWDFIILKAYYVHTVYVFSRNCEEIILVFFFFSKNETLILRPSKFSSLNS